MWELDYKESWAMKNWCFWTVVLEKTLESPLDARRSNQSILKEISPGCSLEGLMLKLKVQFLATWYEESTEWKRPVAGKDWRQEEKGTTEDEIVGCHHWFNGHELGKLQELVFDRNCLVYGSFLMGETDWGGEWVLSFIKLRSWHPVPSLHDK